MQITITHDGQTTVEDIDIDVGGLRLSEAVTVEKLIGDVKWNRLISGDVAVAVSPSTIQALIYAKLHARFPGIGVDGFDFELNNIPDTDTDTDDDAGSVVLPMTLPDGTELEGSNGDPTKAASG